MPASALGISTASEGAIVQEFLDVIAILWALIALHTSPKI